MRVFSGIRPTGDIHIGNYFGAINQWIKLQNKTECVFSIVDLHAITTPYDKKKLQQNILDLAIVYLAAGLNPKKCIFFVQSSIKEHAELAWLLSSITPLGELRRMTQFKEKSERHANYVNAGLLNYPVLMAADILLYQADIVPVGEDQIQHVELARGIARKFNAKFGNTFNLPGAQLQKTGAKIMSLQNPAKKMSKTDDPKACINLFDSPGDIKAKVMAAKTDSGKNITYNPKQKPGIANLLTIYSLFSKKPIKQIEKEFSSKGYAEFKKSLTKLLIESLKPFREKRKELSRNPDKVMAVLENGRSKAQKIAQATMAKAKKKMGLI